MYTIFTSRRQEVTFLVELICLSVCLFVNNITKKLGTDCDEILWWGRGWHKEEVIKFR